MKPPAWAADIHYSLPLHPQLLVTGNVRDQFPVWVDQDAGAPSIDLWDLGEVIWEICQSRQYLAMVTANTASGEFSVRSKNADSLPNWLKSQPADGLDVRGLQHLFRLIVANREAPIALLIPYAARIAPASLNLPTENAELLGLSESLSNSAQPARATGQGMSAFNTVIWLATRQEELHPSFAIDSPGLRVISIPSPTLDTRMEAALFVHQGDEAAARPLAEATHGMTIRQVVACARLAMDTGMVGDRYSEAARLVRIGTVEDRWSVGALREKIRIAEDYLGKRVIGQGHAVARAVDILIRSAVGLNGSQVSSSPNRPRGVMFLCGPTGVGKTELAKGIAALVLGEQAEPIRFDMSEFKMDEARQRLIGAPPGYVGYDVGGELTNAVRQNPVCVLLFDEIEKAHPRIFDLFLQILEDGRLTDGRGATVHFSECFLIFTSNLGTVEVAEATQAVNAVSYNMDPDDVRDTLRRAYDHFFHNILRRPEIRNRLGDSFVPLGYLDKEHFPELLNRAISSLRLRVRNLHAVDVEVMPAARKALLTQIMLNPEDGARGVSNTVETMLINPLGRFLFASEDAQIHGKRIDISGLDLSDGRWEVKANVAES
jgi:energy-coupling factor transporter ATP-binding protein EcfA2